MLAVSDESHLLPDGWELLLQGWAMADIDGARLTHEISELRRVVGGLRETSARVDAQVKALREQAKARSEDRAQWRAGVSRDLERLESELSGMRQELPKIAFSVKQMETADGSLLQQLADLRASVKQLDGSVQALRDEALSREGQRKLANWVWGVLVAIPGLAAFFFKAKGC